MADTKEPESATGLPPSPPPPTTPPGWPAPPLGPQPTDRNALRQLASGAPAEQSLNIEGTTVASFALSRSTRRLSVADLNHIGLVLLQTCVENKEYKALATIYATLASVNKDSRPAGSVKGMTGSPAGRKALTRVLAASAASTVVDVPAREDKP